MLPSGRGHDDQSPFAEFEAHPGVFGAVRQFPKVFSRVQALCCDHALISLLSSYIAIIAGLYGVRFCVMLPEFPEFSYDLLCCKDKWGKRKGQTWML